MNWYGYLNTLPVTPLWNTIADIESQSKWRSDLSKVVVDKNQKQLVWTEYLKNNQQFTFRVKVKEEYSRFEIEIINNKNFSGCWIGLLQTIENGYTEIDFTEVSIVQNPVFRLMSFLFFDLEKTVDLYISDLEKYLQN